MLFRKEAVEARQAQFLGSIRIGRQPSFTVVAVTSIFFAVALITFVTLGDFTRKAHLPGILVSASGTLTVTSALPATVVEVLVAEGAEVHKGDRLARLDLDRLTKEGSAADLIRTSIAQRRNALAAERRSTETQARQKDVAYIDRIRSMELEQERAEADIKSLRRRVALAEGMLNRYQELARERFMGDLQVQQKQDDVIDLGSRLNNAERSLISSRRERDGLIAERAQALESKKGQLAQIDERVATLDQEATENSVKSELYLTAPRRSFVSSITTHAGAAVTPNQTLLSLLPIDELDKGDARNSLEAELYGTSRLIGFVQVGHPVWLRYAAFPFEKFGMAAGTVSGVSRTPINPQDLPSGQAKALLDAVQSNEPLYRVTVAIARQDIETYGKATPLKAGMTLQADVLEDKRAIWEWVLDPLFAAVTTPR